MTFLTDFADQAVVLPLMLAVIVMLWWQGWRRGAAVWLAVLTGTFATMLVLKLAFIACSHAFGPLGIRTPSGHVAAAAFVTGGLATLLVRRIGVVLVLAALAAGLIGFSRLALGVHSLPEVLVGGLVGMTGVFALQRFAGGPPRGFHLGRLGLIALVMIAVFHGMHLPAEAQIRATSLRFSAIFGVCLGDQVRP